MKIEHIGLMAEDTRGLAAWYCEALDMKIVYEAEGENAPVFIRDREGTVLEFFSPTPGVDWPESPNRKVMHIAIGVEDLTAAAAKIEAAGGTLEAETISLFGGAQARFFRDPAGHWLHLIRRPETLW